MYLAFSLMEDCCKLTEQQMAVHTTRCYGIQRNKVCKQRPFTSTSQTSRGLVLYISEQTQCICTISGRMVALLCCYKEVQEDSNLSMLSKN